MNKIGIGGVYVSKTGKKMVNEALDAQRLSAGEMVYKFVWYRVEQRHFRTARRS